MARIYTVTTVDGNFEWDFPGLGKFTSFPERESAAARAFLMAYGRRQWIQDGGAVSAASNGIVDPVARFEGMKARNDLLNSGTDNLHQRRPEGGGRLSWVTQALVSLGTYQGRDVSTPDAANRFVKEVAEKPAFGLGGQVGKARAWLEANSKIIAAKIAELRAQNAPEVDVDAMFAEG